MNFKDYIGKRGENIFSVLITKWCDDKPFFAVVRLGEKHETTDFTVELIDPTSGHAVFYAQVKSTKARYLGKGRDRKIDIKVKREDVEKLKKLNAPIYVIGIDIDNERGYITAVTRKMIGGISGISTRNVLNCRTLKMLWKEVDEYWKARNVLAEESRFAE